MCRDGPVDILLMPGKASRWLGPGGLDDWGGWGTDLFLEVRKFYCRVQELCESRDGRPELSVLTILTVSVDVKQYWTMLTIGLSLSLICQPTSEDIKHHLKEGRRILCVLKIVCGWANKTWLLPYACCGLHFTDSAACVLSFYHSTPLHIIWGNFGFARYYY